MALAGGSAYELGRSDASSAPAANSPPRTITAEHTATQPCPVSGELVMRLKVTLEVDDDVQSFVLDTDGSLTHDACAFQHEDLTLTLDGDPNIDFSMHAAGTGVEFQPIVSGMGGGFEWSAGDGRSGRCAIELETITNFAQRTRTVRGSVCGHTIDQTVSWNPVS
jgi:hypothetical protein